MKRAIAVLIVFCFTLLFLLSYSSFAVADYRSSKTSKEKYKAGEVLVKFKPGIQPEQKNSLHDSLGSKKLKTFEYLRIEQVKIKEGLDVEEAIARYRKDPNVEYAEPNFLYQHAAIPNDPLYSQLWGLSKINASSAWDVTTGSSAVVIADIDTGMQYTHPDLSANVWTNPGEVPGNGIDDDGNGYIDDIHGIDTFNNDSDPQDDVNHGTHTAGTIGAVGNNRTGVAGVNWNVKIMPLKFLGPAGGFTADAIECFEYVRKMKARGINIVATNNSWGGSAYSQALADAVNAQRDTLCVAAAGNDNLNNDVNPSFPANLALPNVISVAATTSTDGKASFSNYGRTTVHLGAPGEGIVSTIPIDLYASYSGTSMATPHVTGVAALLKAQDPFRDMTAIRNLILSGGDDIAAMDGITITGKRLNAYSSLSGTGSVFSLHQYPMYPELGVAYTITVLSIQGAQSSGPVTVTSAGFQSTTLHDDGLAPDLFANDGMFSGTWTLASPTDTILTFSSPAGSKTINIAPLAVTKYEMKYAALNVPYSDYVKAQGGYPPYSWSIIAGQLPPGLSLNGSTGEIAGLPAAKGAFEFTVQVNDTVQSAIKDVRIEIGDEEIWIYDSGREDRAGENMVIDANGNIYLAGYTKNSINYDYQLVKMTSRGDVLWERAYDGGFDDVATGIAVDAGGFVYLSGYSLKEYISLWGTKVYLYESRTIKYAPDGTILWIRDASPDLNDNYGYGIAVDGTGFITVAVQSDYTCYLVRYDPAGNELWSKSSQYARCSAITADEYGNTYMTAGTLFRVSKYNPSGDVVWTNDYATGYALPNDITVDTSGNVYVTGWYGTTFPESDILTIKLDASGGLLWSKDYMTGGNYYGNGIVVDSIGNVYVAGHYATETGTDYLLITYDAAGALITSSTKDLSDKEYGLDAAFDSEGILLVSGERFNGLDYDAFVIRYSAPQPVDTQAPIITAFDLPATSNVLTVPITTFTATDNIGVVGNMVTESPTPPAGNDVRWSASPPASYTFTAAGTQTLYAWAKDGAGNVSGSASDSVLIELWENTIVITKADWSASLLTLTVYATSDYGAEAALKLQRGTNPYLAPMTWNAKRRRWEYIQGSVIASPGTVTVSGPEGSATATVQTIK